MPDSKRKNILKSLSIIALSSFIILFLPHNFIKNIHAQASITWDGGGDTFSWSDPLNWDTDTVPTSSDDVFINTATTVKISEGIQINSLELGLIDGSINTVLEFTHTAITSNLPLEITNNLVINPGALITHTLSTAEINITVGGESLINGDIDASAKGYDHGEGPGAGTNGQGAGGGSHAGNGGMGELGRAGGTVVYGSIQEPITYGSGGGVKSTQGKGGGAIKLQTSGTITVNGTIKADGERGLYQYVNSSYQYGEGGGAGGSIWIDANTLLGIGSVSANGGIAVALPKSYGYAGGSGGGGRIALYFTTNNLTTTQITANGGTPGRSEGLNQKGGAGTIYLKPNNQTLGDLVINNNNTSWYLNTRSKSAETVLENNLEINDLTITKASNTILDSTISISEELDLNTNSWLDVQENANISYQTFLQDSSIIIDNGGTILLVDENNDLTIPEGMTYTMNHPRTYRNIIVNGIINHSQNTTVQNYTVNLSATNNITINNTGSININNLGYEQGEGPGEGKDGDGGSGGSHGGNGGDSEARSSYKNPYGSITEPSTIGSGGGVCGTAGNGGGALKLSVAGTLTLDGPITANGGKGSYRSTNSSYQYAAGGGSGGSIWIIANTITGTSNITTNGGDTTATPKTYGKDGGAGGGGRIALYYTTNLLSETQISARGGTPGRNASPNQKGGAGTIYLKDSSQESGDLVINNENTSWFLTDSSRTAETLITETLPLESITVKNYARANITGELTINQAKLQDIRQITYDTNTLLRSGYAIDSWNTSSDGTGTTYTETEVNTLTTTIPSLYLQWLALEKTINFNANTADGTPPSNIVAQPNDEIQLPSPTNLTKNNYTFIGWSVAIDSEEILEAGSPFTVPTEDTTLFARWIQTYEYENNADGETITLTGYNGTETDIEIPSEIDTFTVSQIGDNAFYTSDLTNVVIPETVTRIGINAFMGSELETVTLHNNITEIKEDAFRLNKITAISIPTSLIKIEEGVFDGNQISSLTIPSNIKEIDDYAFSYNQITSLTLNEGLEVIGSYAFQVNKLTSVNIPNSVTNLGIYAFAYNPNLKHLSLSLKTGYTTTWTNQSNRKEKNISKITDLTTSYIKTVALNKYNLNFFGNSQNTTNIPTELATNYNSRATIPSSRPTKAGYTFNYWTLQSNGTGTRYLPGETILISDTTNLYAQWTINRYSISYQGVGNNLPSNAVVPYNGTYTIPSNIPEYEGFTFLGWSIQSDDTIVKYDSGDNIKITNNITLYPVWEEIEEQEEPLDTPKEPNTNQKSPLNISEIKINGKYQESEEENIVITTSEEVEITIPIENILGEAGEIDDVDTVIIRIQDQEYEMSLSEDKQSYTAQVMVPDVMGTHIMEVISQKDGEEISTQSINLVVKEEDNNNFIYIFVGLLILVGGIAVIIKKNN